VRIFLAGATGVIGRRIVPLLIERGHEVAGMTRSHSNVEALLALGVQPVVCNVFDAEELRESVVAFAPQLVMHQLTDLPDDASKIPERPGANARIRREGTRNLLAAAADAGVDGFIAQSVAWTLAGDGGAAVEEMESIVLAASGVILRYGQFYGQGTYHPSEPPQPPRVEIDKAAARTVELLEAPSGIITIVDD
jgi:nucleoside-diphosphate-sugar epimerase